MPTNDKFNLDGFKVDENDICTADGGFVGDLTGNLIGDVTGDLLGFALGSEDYITSDGAISPDISLSVLDASTASTVMALGSPAHNYTQRISISCIDASNSCTVTFRVSGVGEVTATFSAAGQSIDLISRGSTSASRWIITGLYGATIA